MPHPKSSHGSISKRVWSTRCAIGQRATADTIEAIARIWVDVFTQPNPNVLKFESDALGSSDNTARDPRNGVLDIRDGDTLKGVYNDTIAVRTSTAAVNCFIAF